MTPCMMAPSPTQIDPTKLEVLALLRRAGKSRAEIQRVLKISERTYYRWLAELRRVERDARRSDQADA
jgi:DNA-binding CsgD family transcriptional regulator